MSLYFSKSACPFNAAMTFKEANDVTFPAFVLFWRLFGTAKGKSLVVREWWLRNFFKRMSDEREHIPHSVSVLMAQEEENWGEEKKRRRRRKRRAGCKKWEVWSELGWVVDGSDMLSIKFVYSIHFYIFIELFYLTDSLRAPKASPGQLRQLQTLIEVEVSK